LNVKNDHIEFVYVRIASTIKNVFRKLHVYVVVLLQSLTTKLNVTDLIQKL
jgi:hypothetical protein